MKILKNNIFRILSQDWSGLVAATMVGFLGLSIYIFSRDLPGSVGTGLWVLSGILLALTVVMVCGSVFHLYQVGRHLRKFPAPGKLVDVGGYKMHILAEGTSKNSPTIIWIPGSHDQGLAFHHLHRVMANETRSILFDRAGSGWSDVGPFPKSLPTEIAELHTLLEKSGEKGPFIIIAHSLGGLLAQNFAATFPEQTAGLLLLDSGCPDATVYATFLKKKSVPGYGIGLWFLTAIGVAWIITGGILKKNPPWLAIYEDDIKPQVLFSNCRTKLSIGFMSALTSIMDWPFDMIKGQGRLGNLPLISVIPPVPVDDQVEEIKHLLPYLTDRQVRNFIDMRIDSQNQTARLSTRGEQYYSPEKSTHGFPFEVPEFTLTMVRKIMSTVKETEQISS